MQCPNDSTTLVMSERSGIEIDYCPQCRGVWLDRGELDKIIDRSLEQQPAPQAPQTPPPPPQVPQGYDNRSDNRSDNRGYDNRGYQGGYKKKRKESWLSELFD